MNLLNEINKISKSKTNGALCTIVQTKGSTPRKVGSKMIVTEDGKILGSIGGGNLEKKVIENALYQINKNEAKLYKHDLLHQHSMCCGGVVDIYIEPIKKVNRLYIFGSGHTGKALAKCAIDLDFDIYVIDNRKEQLDDLDSDEINKMNLDYKKVLPSLPFDNNTYVVIMTYEHSYDRDILSYCIKKPHAYIGMIGSKRKIEVTKKNFIEGKLATKKELENLDMPIGLNIKAKQPEEIAISILAKLIEVKNG